MHINSPSDLTYFTFFLKKSVVRWCEVYRALPARKKPHTNGWYHPPTTARVPRQWLILPPYYSARPPVLVYTTQLPQCAYSDIGWCYPPTIARVLRQWLIISPSTIARVLRQWLMPTRRATIGVHCIAPFFLLRTHGSYNPQHQSNLSRGIALRVKLFLFFSKLMLLVVVVFFGGWVKDAVLTGRGFWAEEL